MRGYTLIELLATIVILAIILLISVPIISGLLENTRKSAFELSVKNIVKAGEYTFANGMLKPSRELVYTFEDGKITGNYPDALLEFSGEVPISGNLIIREDGKIAASLFNGKYCAVKDYDTNEVTITNAGIDDCYSEISLPEVVLNGMTPVNVEIPLSYTDLGAVAKTIGGEAITQIDTKIYKNSIEVPSINTSEKGTYKIIYTVYEGSKMNYTEREVNVVDTTKPTLTVPLSTSIVIADVNTFDLLSGVSVTDNSNETLTINVSGNLSRIAGSYTITYSATDSSNNVTTVERIINVNDIESPVITLNGASVINLNIGDTYTELNANATDDTDGDLTTSITKTGSVNTSLAGTYLITYQVKDSSNNESSITRTVNVIDNVAPNITGLSVISSSINPTSVTISKIGTAVDNVGLRTINPYTFEISTNGTNWTASCINEGENCFISGLNSNSTYYYRVCAQDISGNVACTNSKSLTTIALYYYDRYLINDVWSSAVYQDLSGYYLPCTVDAYDNVHITYIYTTEPTWKGNYYESPVESRKTKTVGTFFYIVNSVDNSYFLIGSIYGVNTNTNQCIGNFAKWERSRTRNKGTLYAPNIQGTASQYPIDGIHTDGYWYTRKTLIN